MSAPASLGQDEPLAFSVGPMPAVTLPPVIRVRLEVRCRAEHLVDARGRPDLFALADRALLEEGGGVLTIGAARRLIDSQADRDLGQLVRAMVRAVLVRDGFHDAAALL